MIDIIESDYNSYDKELTFYDTKRDELFKIKVNGSIDIIFSKWIIGFLTRINDLGSFGIYKILEENERLKKEIERFEKIMGEKNSLIEDLEIRIEALKQESQR